MKTYGSRRRAAAAVDVRLHWACTDGVPRHCDELSTHSSHCTRCSMNRWDDWLTNDATSEVVASDVVVVTVPGRPHTKFHRHQVSYVFVNDKQWPTQSSVCCAWDKNLLVKSAIGGSTYSRLQITRYRYDWYDYRYDYRYDPRPRWLRSTKLIDVGPG